MRVFYLLSSSGSPSPATHKRPMSKLSWADLSPSYSPQTVGGNRSFTDGNRADSIIWNLSHSDFFQLSIQNDVILIPCLNVCLNKFLNWKFDMKHEVIESVEIIESTLYHQIGEKLSLSLCGPHNRTAARRNALRHLTSSCEEIIEFLCSMTSFFLLYSTTSSSKSVHRFRSLLLNASCFLSLQGWN